MELGIVPDRGVNMCGPETFVIRAVGGSMAPEFCEGDYLYVDPDQPVRAGRHVAVWNRDTGETKVRLLVEHEGRRVLRASREGCAEHVVGTGNETEILGVVVFRGREVS